MTATTLIDNLYQVILPRGYKTRATYFHRHCVGATFRGKSGRDINALHLLNGMYPPTMHGMTDPLNTQVNLTEQAACVELHTAEGRQRLHIGGAWTLAHYRSLAPKIAVLKQRFATGVELEFSGLSALDTAGAELLCELIGAERFLGQSGGSGLKPAQQALLLAVANVLARTESVPGVKRYVFGDVLANTGEAVIVFWRHIVDLLSFIGLIIEGLARTVFRPWRWRYTALVANLEQTGFNAVPIVALLTFLVGAVIALLGARILSHFGATSYTVGLVAIAFLREFGVLLAAILVAGRSASAFAAQIGSMRANEEIDAIRVLGLNPVELLVLPRVLAMMIAMPILAFIATVSGLAGGMAVCAISLDIQPVMFISMMLDEISLDNYYVGLGKAPIFAFLIAAIGCLEGFKVSGSAQSVGKHTTSAVVQSIFTVLVVDAIAAVFCMEMGW